MNAISLIKSDSTSAFARGAVAWLARMESFPPSIALVFRIARFLAVGLVGLGFDSGVFWLLFTSGSGAPVARAVSLVVATLVTWALNRLITFAPSGRSARHELMRYAGVALLAQGFNYALFLLLLRLLSQDHPLACLVISAVATAALSFTGQSLFAFRRVARAS